MKICTMCGLDLATPPVDEPLRAGAAMVAVERYHQVCWRAYMRERARRQAQGQRYSIAQHREVAQAGEVSYASQTRVRKSAPPRRDLAALRREKRAECERLLRAGMSMKAIARTIHSTERTVATWKREMVPPGWALLMEVGRELGFSYATLLRWIDVIENPPRFDRVAAMPGGM